MQKALHLKTTVLPRGKIEVVDRELRVGESMDVVVLRSAVAILNQALSQRLFKTAADEDAYLKDERASYER